MHLSIIIPNYNGSALLKKNLPALLKATVFLKKKNFDMEIIIVDDASTDGSISLISDFESSVEGQRVNLQFLKNEKNLGFSSTVNRGVSKSVGEIVILLNTDVSPEGDFLTPLVDHFKDEEIFAVGCMDKSVEKEKIVLRGRGIGKWQRGFLVHSKGEVNQVKTLWVSGGSGAFRKSTWQTLGGFNPLYDPFYWEDIDLSYRALKSGYKILFEPKSVVVHRHEEGAIQKKYSAFQIKTIAYRNQFIFVWKNVTDLNIKLSHLVWFPYHCLKAFISGDFAFFVGFCQALIRLPKIIQYSLMDRRYFLKSDKEIIQELSE